MNNYYRILSARANEQITEAESKMEDLTQLESQIQDNNLLLARRFRSNIIRENQSDIQNVDIEILLSQLRTLEIKNKIAVNISFAMSYIYELFKLMIESDEKTDRAYFIRIRRRLDQLIGLLSKSQLQGLPLNNIAEILVRMETVIGTAEVRKLELIIIKRRIKDIMDIISRSND